jgi:phosphoglycolate phosphatase-like HAD superfamily hydrolase
MIFDLDGTLVQIEKLKARSYAKAAVDLRPELDEERVVEAFKDVVGLSRRQVAQSLLQRFGLAEVAAERMDKSGSRRFTQRRQGSAGGRHGSGGRQHSLYQGTFA